MKQHPGFSPFAQVRKMPVRHIHFATSLFLALLTAFLFATQTVSACKCVPVPTPQDALADSSAVFAGKVTGIREDDSANSLEVSFRVYQVWKGDPQSEMVVMTNRDSTACGFSFEKDREYLVYAQEVDGSLQVSLCSRTKLLNTAGEDLDVLKAGITPALVETQVPFIERIFSTWGGVIAIGVGLGLVYILIMLARSRIIQATTHHAGSIDPKEDKKE